MDTNTSSRRGPGLRLEIGVIGAVIIALVLMVGAAQGIGHLTSRGLAQAEEEGIRPGMTDFSQDGSVTLMSGTTSLGALDLRNIDVTTDKADFEIRFVDTENATLEVEGDVAPNLSWVLKREGETLTVATQMGAGSVESAEGIKGGAASGGETGGEPESSGVTAPAEPSVPIETAVPVDPTADPLAAGDQPADPATDAATVPVPADAPAQDATDQTGTKVTLTLPEELREQSMQYTYRVLGGSLTMTKASGYTNLMVLGGVADVRGDTDALSAKVTSGKLDFLVNNAQSVDMEVSGEASITGEFTGVAPQYVYTILNGGTMDLTFSEEMMNYELRIDNQAGELNNLLKKSAKTSKGQYPALTIEGSMVGGLLTLR